ncbi:hypothetical protein DL93DRAFT_2112524 [Clavulina sp. PMI_390]|nr:hypothetical protein DL93DRAFT_2112524 [Clavulina sp. PMI_390]
MGALISWIPRQLCALALIAPTTRLQRLLAFGIIVASQIWTIIAFIDEPGLRGLVAYCEAAGLGGFLLLSGNLLVATEDPRTSITWLKPSEKSTGSSIDTDVAGGEKSQGAKTKTWLADHTLGFPTRVWWAYSMTHSPRLLGTNVQTANIVPLPPTLSSSRLNFCLNRLFTLVTSLPLMFATAMAPKYSQFLLDAATNQTPTLLQRAIVTSGGLIFTWNLIKSGHCFLACLAVALRLSEPDEWPNLFGALGDAYTVRRAWGRTWHQMLRKPFEAGGNGIVSLFGAKPHTFASKYLKLYTAFALSTFAHVWGDFVIHGNTLPPETRSNTWAKFSLDALITPQFFMSQAVGIMIEDHVIDMIEWAWRTGKFGKVKKAKGPPGAKAKSSPGVVWYGRAIGYAWVFVWFCATYPQYQNRLNLWSYMEPPPVAPLYD